MMETEENPRCMDNDFTSLVKKASDLLGNGGIDSEDVNPNDILELMMDYTSNRKDWDSYVKTWSSEGEPYVRNLVDSGNGKYNLVRGFLSMGQ